MNVKVSFDLIDEEEDGFSEDMEELKQAITDLGYEFENFNLEVI
ncbi:MAG: hypothetical protein RR322_01775 [Oscillospiraceae bacterium]